MTDLRSGIPQGCASRMFHRVEGESRVVGQARKC